MILYSVLIVTSIVILVIILWKIETNVPKIPKVKEGNKEAKIKSIKRWFKVLERRKKFNGVALLTHKDEVIFKLVMGVSGATQKPLTESSMLRIASLSKSFTAFAIMNLVKKEKIHYNDLVSEHVTFFKHKQVTIRNLLNHTSGILVDYIAIAKKNKPSKNYILSITDAVHLVLKVMEEDKLVPNIKFVYNNTNYIFLAYIVEKVTGLSFEEYIKEEICKPLGLIQTRVWNLLSKETIENTANIAEDFEAYLKSKPIKLKPTWIDGVAGDGAIFSSINDLEKWSKIWEDNSLLNKEELKEAYKPHQLKDGTYSDYGFGWVLNRDNSIWHNGKWLAANSLMIKNFKKETCLILVDNSANLRFEKITKKLLYELEDYL
ncbi:Serine hydrolase [Tenacibaculum sp. 190524A02b]|uniref:Serine hydrolase n=1 Tax=Tenacibaculum vairaonense TaxID=3137860 RepID=A0ABM9PRK7_9FLAO